MVGAQLWPQYSAGAADTLVLDLPPRVERVGAPPVCAFWAATQFKPR